MLVLKTLSLSPMTNTERSWMWVGHNFVEGNSSQEKLAVRFKTLKLATDFHDKVMECVEVCTLLSMLLFALLISLLCICSIIFRKYQQIVYIIYHSFKQKLKNAPEEAKKEEVKETPSQVAPLRLPKHLQTSARADEALFAKVAEYTGATTGTTPTEPQTSQPASETGLTQSNQFAQSPFKQNFFARQEEKKTASTEDEEEDEDEHHEEDYDPECDNSEGYYNEVCGILFYS